MNSMSHRSFTAAVNSTENMPENKKSLFYIFFRGILPLFRRKSPFDWAENFSLLHKIAKTEILSLQYGQTVFFSVKILWAPLWRPEKWDYASRERSMKIFRFIRIDQIGVLYFFLSFLMPVGQDVNGSVFYCNKNAWFLLLLIYNSLNKSQIRSV